MCHGKFYGMTADGPIWEHMHIDSRYPPSRIWEYPAPCGWATQPTYWDCLSALK
jgi:hypothetical protein